MTKIERTKKITINLTAYGKIMIVNYKKLMLKVKTNTILTE